MRALLGTSVLIATGVGPPEGGLAISAVTLAVSARGSDGVAAISM